MSNDGNMELTVLEDIANDTELVEVSATALSTERLLERDLDVADRVLVPGRVHRDVGETEDKDVLDHLLTEVVIDTEDLLFFPVRVQSLLEVARALKILAEGLLNL